MSQDKSDNPDLAFATTDELFNELKGRSEAYVFCMVSKTGTFQVTYGGSMMANVGLIETARIAVRRQLFGGSCSAA